MNEGLSASKLPHSQQARAALGNPNWTGHGGMEPSAGDLHVSTSTMDSGDHVRSTISEQMRRKKMKPYMCVLCKRAFWKAMSLQQHMITVHGLKEEEDEEDDDDDVDCGDDVAETRDSLGHDTSSLIGFINGTMTQIQAILPTDVCGESGSNEASILNDVGGDPTDSGIHSMTENGISHIEKGTSLENLQGGESPRDILAQAASAADIYQLCAKREDAREMFYSIVDPKTSPVTTLSIDTADVPLITSSSQPAESIQSTTPTPNSSRSLRRRGKSVSPHIALPRTSLPLDLSVKVQDANMGSRSSVAGQFGCRVCSSNFPDLKLCLAHMAMSHNLSEQEKLTPISTQGSLAEAPSTGQHGDGITTSEKISPTLRRTRKRKATPGAREIHHHSCIDSGNSDSQAQGKASVKHSHAKESMDQTRASKVRVTNSRGQRRCTVTSSNAKTSGSKQKSQQRRSPRNKKQTLVVKLDNKRPVLGHSKSERKNMQGEEKKKKKRREKDEVQKKEEKCSGQMRGRKSWLGEKVANLQITGQVAHTLSDQDPGRRGRRKGELSLTQKLADLRQANTETEKLTIAVQRIARSNLRHKAKRGKDGRSKGKEINKNGTDDTENMTLQELEEPAGLEATLASSALGDPIEVDKAFYCLICYDKYSSLPECISHMNAVHIMADSPASSAESKTAAGQKEEETSGSIQKAKGRKKIPKFPCKYCDELFKSTEGLRSHMSFHCGKVEEKCQRCAVYKARPSPAAFEEMSRRVEEVRDKTDMMDYGSRQGKRIMTQFFQCVVCNSCFAIEKHFRNHLNLHENVTCQFCNAVFPTARALCKHVTHHNMGPLRCRVCKQTFYSTYMLLMHMRGHSKELRCEHCGTTFMFRHNLVRHVKAKHTPGDGTVQSDDALHQEGDAPKRRKGCDGDLLSRAMFKCNLCGNLHRTAATLKRHTETYHPESVEDRGKFVCEICGAVRHKIHQLKAHMMCHRERSHKCGVCGKVFLRPSGLKHHIQQVHERRRDYVCRYCGKRVSTPESLRDHELLHTGEKPYVCIYCNKRFRLRQEYRTHVSIEHSKVKPYPCNECDKSFFTHTSLAKHRRVHDPRENCACIECGKRFKRLDLLKLHLVKHRQTIKCMKCNRYFSSEFSFHYHMNKIHKINLYRSSQLHLISQETSPPGSQSQLPNSSEASGASEHQQRITNGIPDAAGMESAISLTVVNDETQEGGVEASRNAGTDTLPTPATIDPSDIRVTRLSDPTNLAITTILSQLCERTLASITD